MTFSSLWEMECFYFPDVAEEMYEAELSSGEFGKLMAEKSLQDLMKRKENENCN